MYKPGGLSEQAQPLLDGRKWAIRLLTIAAALGLIASELHRVRRSLVALQADPFTIAPYPYLLLLVLILAMIPLWMWATHHEATILITWCDPKDYAVPSDLGTLLREMGIGVTLVILLFSARNPLAFGIAFSLYSFVTMATVRYMNRELATVVQACRVRLAEDEGDPRLRDRTQLYGDGLTVVDDYFLQRPHTPRHVGILVASLVGTGFAVASVVSKRGTFALVAYIIFILIIVVSELVLAMWRQDRDRRLRPLEGKRYSLERDTTTVVSYSVDQA